MSPLLKSCVLSATSTQWAWPPKLFLFFTTGEHNALLKNSHPKRQKEFNTQFEMMNGCTKLLMTSPLLTSSVLTKVNSMIFFWL